MNLPAQKRPLSFLLVCQTYPPVLGGSEIEAQRICSALVKRGYGVTVVCAGGPPMPPLRDWVDPQGVPVRLYAENWKGTWKNVVFAVRMAGMMIRERRKYQVVYFLMQGIHVAAGLPLARMLNKPIIMKLAGSGEVPRMFASSMGRLELRWLNRWAKKLLILNEGMRQEALAHGLSADKLMLMPNPVDTQEFSPATEVERLALCARFGVSPSAQVIIYTGRLAQEKALPGLVDAFHLARKQVPHAVLVLVGDGPIRPALIEQARQLGLPEENIRFTGRVPASEVSLWLKISTIFALISPSEGFSCALEEAMSTGIPSVVSDIPANRQLVEDDVHGLLVPVGAPEKTAEAIVRLLENEPLRLRLGDASRKRVMENFSTDHVVAIYEALFQEATAK